MRYLLLGAAFLPTVLVILIFYLLILTTKRFIRYTGEISDFNKFQGTRRTLIISMIFWEICQTAFLAAVFFLARISNPFVLYALIASLVSGLAGLLFRSRTALHDFLICTSIGLSYIVMFMENSSIFTLAVTLCMTALSIILLIKNISNKTTQYWKIEILILALYGIWNILTALQLS